MDLTPNHTLKNYVKLEKILQPTFRRIATFPEILRDESGNYVGIMTLQGERIEEPMVAFLLDLIRWGNTKLVSYTTLRDPVGKEGLDVPEWRDLPGDLHSKFGRAVRESFQFWKELPAGMKWSPKNEKKMVESKKSFHLPTLCHGNRGYTGSYAGQTPVFTAYDAACIAAIQMGARLIEYDNGISNLHVDDTPERVAFLKGRMEAPDFVKVVEDSGWSFDEGSSRPSRGIRDYNRKTRFERKPTDEEMTLFKELLSLDKCPGWTGIYAKAEDVAGTTYTFRTTWDSSD